MIDFIVIIPARLKSSRLDKKLLQIINNKPLLHWTYENAVKSGAKQVLIATDSTKIIEAMGADKCVLTSLKHSSGTSRIAEVIQSKNIADNEIIVNLQGDEPMLPPSVIRQVANNLANYSCATICEKITTVEQYFDKNCVKVVFDKFGKALYFSRSPIPAFRDDKVNLSSCFKHIGIYSYKAKFIKKYLQFKISNYEKYEKLEQLTILEQGFDINIENAIDKTGIGVDTQNDLDNLKQFFKEKQ